MTVSRLGFIGRIMGAPISHLRRQIDIGRMVDELNGLSDRELSDIGICREQIPSIARRHHSR